MNLLRLSFALFLIFNTNQEHCSQLPSSFSSYSEAISTVRSFKYKIADEANTSTSSWIRSAEFYSCEGKYGFMIISTDSREYIHKNVPIDVWRRFKTATSYGSYYNSKIKGRYQLKI